MKRYISASGASAIPPNSRTSRIFSPSSVAPGSRTMTGFHEASAWPSSSTWVVLPEPSTPSNVMNNPLAIAGSLGRGLFRSRRYPQPPLRLLAGAASREIVLGHQLVLQPAQIRVLG